MIRALAHNRTALAAAAAASVGSAVSPRHSAEAATGAAAAAAPQEAVIAENVPTIARPSFREQIVGSYENRIRNFSAPERVFEFFASVTTESGECMMTPEDFSRAITPYQQRAGVPVLGSQNAKFNFKVLLNRPSKEQVRQYKELLAEVLADSKVTAEECRKLLVARDSLGIDAEAHHKVLAELEVTNAQLEELMEAKGGIPRRAFFTLVDTNGDGLISYSEFMLFHTLLAIPQHRLETAFRMFDRDDSGSIELSEFESFMAVLRNSTNAGQKEVSWLHRAEDKSTYRSLFGADGTENLTLERFQWFARTLRVETLRMQFEAWDTDGSGALSGMEFARFLVSMISTERELQRRYLERSASPAVAALTVNITEKEFLAFHEFLHHLEAMKVAMRVLGSNLSQPEFLLAAAAAVSRAIAPVVGAAAVASDDVVRPELSTSVAEVLFALFDANGDGRLDFEEFAAVMEHQDASADPPRDIGITRWLDTVLQCAKRELT